MTIKFGDFELDEERREFALRGKLLAVQPKVFDLLVYLLRNAGRVVPKSELLDRLWPNLHVTEASLQRAVSLLRTALRKGSLDTALKSYSGRGYRLAIDQPDIRPFIDRQDQPGHDMSPHLREHAANRDWSAIVASLKDTPLEAVSIGDLALWALAVECLGRSADAIPLLQQIVERTDSATSRSMSVEAAATLAKIHFERGQVAVSRGWLQRALSSQDGSSPSTRAYLLWSQSRLRAFEGNPQEALDTAMQALAAAEAGGTMALRALTLAYVGFYNIALGNTRAGTEQQDHAAALAMSSSVDPITGGLIYCNILWSCRAAGDWSRALQWVGGFESWCDANYAGFSAACHLHRAEVAGTQGTLSEALARIGQALQYLPVSEPWATADAYRVRGDIQAAMGNLANAQGDYKRAYELGWDAEPGHAVLLAQSGDIDGAIAALDRVLLATGWFGLQRRGMLLAHKARINAMAGRCDEARACIALLQDYYETWPSAAVHALVQEAQAMIAFHEKSQDPTAAQAMSLARQLWTSAGAEYDVARVRLALARIMLATGDTAGAHVEAHCCVIAAEKIGARRLLEEASELLPAAGTAAA